MTDNKVSLKVENLSKKFASDIRYNLFYGIVDLVRIWFGLSVNYKSLRKKEFWALSDINFELNEGEILGIVGENGSGKTTLMRMIANIYPTERGNILAPNDIQIAPIFAIKGGLQNLYTGRENIFIKGAMYGMSKNEIKAKISFIENFSELGEKLDMPIGNYSSGMKARLAFSIAMSVDPDIFIIDEALSVGDSIFQTKCFDYLKGFVKRPGKSVLFISNTTRKILNLATRLIVMNEGRIIHESTNIPHALRFYISNCIKDIDAKKKEEMIRKVENYGM